MSLDLDFQQGDAFDCVQCVTDSINSIANGNNITQGEIENIYKIYHSIMNNNFLKHKQKAETFYNIVFENKDWCFTEENITLSICFNFELDRTVQLIHFNKNKKYNIIGRLHSSFTPDVKILNNQCVSRINTFLTIVKNKENKYKIVVVDLSSLHGTFDHDNNKIKVKAYDLNKRFTILIGNYGTSLTIF